jgi:FXSXX-COOH protein
MLSTDERPREVTSPVADLSSLSLAEIASADFSDRAIARILGESLNPPVPVAAFSSSI